MACSSFTRGHITFVDKHRWLVGCSLTCCLRYQGCPYRMSIQQRVPPVNKLTLVKSNKDLRAGEEEKQTISQLNAVDEKMDTGSNNKSKRRQRRRNVSFFCNQPSQFLFLALRIFVALPGKANKIMFSFRMFSYLQFNGFNFRNKKCEKEIKLLQFSVDCVAFGTRKQFIELTEQVTQNTNTNTGIQ